MTTLFPLTVHSINITILVHLIAIDVHPFTSCSTVHYSSNIIIYSSIDLSINISINSYAMLCYAIEYNDAAVY